MENSNIERISNVLSNAQLTVGSTLASLSYWLKPYLEKPNIGILPRNPERNILLGTILTHPKDNLYVLGLAYYDLKDNYFNEDMIVFDLNTGKWKAYYRGKFEKITPEYRGSHWGDKSYFLKASFIRCI